MKAVRGGIIVGLTIGWVGCGPVGVVEGSGGTAGIGGAASGGTSSETSSSGGISSAPDAGRTCKPGLTQACSCGDAGDGQQTCNATGTGFDSCSCVQPDGGTLNGTITTLYIHGRDADGQPSDWSYWQGNGKVRPGVNAFPVNWVGNDRIGQTNITIRNAFNKYCTGNNSCYVACHSAGCAQVGYALDLYGTTGGVDSWNIYWIAAAGSAEGGSEVADLKLFSVAVPLDEDLRTTVMRTMYNHDNTMGVTHWMFAGSGYSDSHPILSISTEFILPGDDDLMVAYHSSCAINNASYASTLAWCNSTDFICSGNRLDLMDHADLWALHNLQFLDTNGDYSHFLTDANEGICSEMFNFVSLNAG